MCNLFALADHQRVCEVSFKRILSESCLICCDIIHIHYALVPVKHVKGHVMIRDAHSEKNLRDLSFELHHA